MLYADDLITRVIWSVTVTKNLYEKLGCICALKSAFKFNGTKFEIRISGTQGA